MVKDQLLKNFPDQKIIQHILDCFGLENLEDTRFFTKQHMQEIDTVQKITDLIEELNEYYLPCKSKIYLKNLTEKKCITVLRQFIKYHNYKCIAMEKSVKGKKQTTYCLMYHNNDTLKSQVANAEEDREFILTFDM